MQNGWVHESAIAAYEALLFYNALRTHKGDFYYSPIALAKREEVGMKYRYLCVAKPKDNASLSSHFAYIEIYKSPEGRPYVTCLHRLDLDQLFSYRLYL